MPVPASKNPKQVKKGSGRPKASENTPPARQKRPKKRKSGPALKPSQVKHAADSREVVYDQHESGCDWLTAESARNFLGWLQSPNPDQPFTDYLFKDRNGVPTKCANVDKQRPFYPSLALRFMYDVLGGHWNGDGGEANGEAMVVGKTALVIEGKHRMVGLAWAEQEWLKHPGKYPHWKENPKIHCFINMGVREDIKSVNTLNTGKPRSLADAIYASGLFGVIDGTKVRDKKKIKALSRMTDYAVRLLWHRTGASRDAFAPKRTHAESLDFIERHPKIMDCVKHIYEEDGGSESRLKYYPSPGYAAALLYLMGSAYTERENDEGTGYMQVECPTEDLLDWSLWDKACDFWTLLASGDKKMEPLRKEVSSLLDSEGGSFVMERTALIVKAWWAFATDVTINEKAIEIETVEGRDGIQVLAEVPLVGEIFGDLSSIDLGEPPKED